MKHMVTKHREDTGVNENCETTFTVNIAHLDLPGVNVGDLLAIPLQLIHYQLIQLTTLKLTN